jgi:hypothetical protein
VLVLALAVAAGAGVSAHRMDEYLQAARLALDPARVQIDLDLTPGIALADAILADIDRNRDGLLSAEEQRLYVALVTSALTLEVDGTPVQTESAAASFPDADAMRRGEGTIRLHSSAVIPRLTNGFHQLWFRNRHHPNRSVYLANALVPASNQVAVTAQRRDDKQTELTIDYVVHAEPARLAVGWLLGGIAAATALSALLIRPLRSLR